jgi:hypothetical protein
MKISKAIETALLVQFTRFFFFVHAALAPYALLAQSGDEDSSVVFTALLRELDLNGETQNRYAITQAEYERLKSAWRNLSRPARSQLLYGSSALFWTGTPVLFLFQDLNNGKSWETHLEQVARYDGRDLSLTLSRLNHPRIAMTVIHARQMLRLR